MASTSADVAIIGGGLIGCCSAYFLRRRGRSVVVIEKGSACAAASGVNFGNLRLQGRAPQEFPLSLRSHTIWEDLARLTGEDCGIVPCGHLYLGFAASDQPKLERAAHDARTAGLDVELLDGPCVRRRWPVLSGAVRALHGRSAMPSPIPQPRRPRLCGWRNGQAHGSSSIRR